DAAMARTLNNLGLAFADQYKYTNAQNALEEAITLYKKSLGGEEHPSVAAALDNLAVVLHRQQKLTAAKKMELKAIDIQHKILSPEHPDLALALNNLGAIYMDEGEYTNAEPCFDEALKIRRKAFTNDHPDLALSLDNRANALRKLNRWQEAEPLAK